MWHSGFAERSINFNALQIRHQSGHSYLAVFLCTIFCLPFTAVERMNECDEVTPSAVSAVSLPKHRWNRQAPGMQVAWFV